LNFVNERIYSMVKEEVVERRKKRPPHHPKASQFC